MTCSPFILSAGVEKASPTETARVLQNTKCTDTVPYFTYQNFIKVFLLCNVTVKSLCIPTDESLIPGNSIR